MKTIYSALVLFSLAVVAQAQSTARSAPDLDLKDIRGRPIHLADYKGKVVLLNFWATWCAPCRTEIPELIKLQREYRRRGLRIIGITYPPEKLTDVVRFTHQAKMNYRVAQGSKETKSSLTSSETLPVTVIVNVDGAVQDVIEGIMYADEFDQKVKPLLWHKRPADSVSAGGRVKGGAVKRTIVVGAAGYQPSKITLRKGVPAQLTFIRKIEGTCGREIVIPAYGINRPLPLNTPVNVILTPRRSGRFKFTCGMDMFRGALIVK